MGDFAERDHKGWYLENEVTGATMLVPEGSYPHVALDKIEAEEKKNWRLKWGDLDAITYNKEAEFVLNLPDGSSYSYVDDTAAAERRSSPRKNIALKITLISGRRIFRTTSENISLGGILLKAVPPRDYSRDLRVLVESSDGSLRLLFKASVVTNSQQKRLRFQEVRTEDLQILEAFLEKHPDAANAKLAA